MNRPTWIKSHKRQNNGLRGIVLIQKSRPSLIEKLHRRMNANEKEKHPSKDGQKHVAVRLFHKLLSKTLALPMIVSCSVFEITQDEDHCIVCLLDSATTAECTPPTTDGARSQRTCSANQNAAKSGEALPPTQILRTQNKEDCYQNRNTKTQKCSTATKICKDQPTPQLCWPIEHAETVDL